MRLRPDSRLLWVESLQSRTPPGCLGLLDTPGGLRTAHLVVPPQLALVPGASSPDHVLLRPLSDEEATTYEPASSLQSMADTAIAGLAGVRARVAPDGSRVVLLASSPEGLPHAVRELTERLGVPVLLRNERAELPDPLLPELLQELEYAGETVVVEGISVFHGQATLRRPTGGTVKVPLSDLNRPG